MVSSDEINYQKLQSILLDSKLPLSLRFRSLFTLKSLNTTEAIDIIILGFDDSSCLLKHELAYVLGQMKQSYAIPALVNVLNDLGQDTMVRHEAGEALGAIGDLSALQTLEAYLNDSNPVIRETCQLAVDLLKHPKSPINSCDKKYASIDPAPPASSELSTIELKNMLMNSELKLFKRYRAMFALRDRGDSESVLALADGFNDSSALFRHEIAYIFGQMQHLDSVPSLISVLSNESESDMVRHEAAEALGSIGTPECLPVLQKFSNDSQRVVKESCIIGLDMHEYENSGDFQYATALK